MRVVTSTCALGPTDATAPADLRWGASASDLAAVGSVSDSLRVGACDHHVERSDS